MPSTYPYGIYSSNPTTTTGVTGFNFPSSVFTPTTLPTPTPPQPKKYVEEERIEKVAKNYVIHEIDQREGIAKPQWKDTMSAMFGDHVKWEELKVLSGKGRPLGWYLSLSSIILSGSPTPLYSSSEAAVCNYRTICALS
jgi:vacuolar protein sorting-associated protein 72